MNREQVSSSAFVVTIEPDTQSDTVKGDAVDLQGADSAEVIVTHGDVTAAAGANRLDLKLQHSDTTTDGDFSDVDADLQRGSFSALENGVTAGAQAVAYVGNKRYLRLVATKTGTASAVLGAVVRKSLLAAG